jgi:methylmalonyl-CoA/ethylmalonyl-CoA epimerase
MTAKDVDRATAFYTDTLRLPFLFRFGDLSFFDCSGIRLMASKPEKPEFDHPGSELYFRVPDIGAACRELGDRGVPVRRGAPSHCPNARSRALDGVFHRQRG